jgi:HAE1 family hydrophobic/amphiphilic exporter-1
LILIGIAGYGLSRVPTGFIPIEDQGYLLVAVQLPDGAALERTQHVLTRSARITGKAAGVDQVITIAGISALDNSSSLANAGVPYLILKGVERARQGRGSALAVRRLERETVRDRGGADPGGPAAADPGYRQRRRLRHAGAAARRQFRFRQACRRFTGAMRRQCVDTERAAAGAVRRSARRCPLDSRGGPDQDPDLHVTTDQIFSTLSSYMGSTFVNQFNKFGRTFQVYARRTAQFRLTPRDIQNMMVRNSNGDMIPLGTVAKITPGGRSRR